MIIIDSFYCCCCCCCCLLGRNDMTMVFLCSITWSKRFNEQFFHNQIECNWIHRSAADHLNSHLYDHSIENRYTIILKMKGIKTGVHSIFLQITSSVRIFFFILFSTSSSIRFSLGISIVFDFWWFRYLTPCSKSEKKMCSSKTIPFYMFYRVCSSTKAQPFNRKEQKIKSTSKYLLCCFFFFLFPAFLFNYVFNINIYSSSSLFSLSTCPYVHLYPWIATMFLHSIQFLLLNLFLSFYILRHTSII